MTESSTGGLFYVYLWVWADRVLLNHVSSVTNTCVLYEPVLFLVCVLTVSHANKCGVCGKIILNSEIKITGFLAL